MNPEIDFNQIAEIVREIKKDVSEAILLKGGYFSDLVGRGEGFQLTVSPDFPRGKLDELTLVFHRGGAVFLFFSRTGKLIADGFWANFTDKRCEGKDISDVTDALVRVFRFGIVWSGWPLRGVWFGIDGHIPSDREELGQLLCRKFVYYSLPWGEKREEEI